MGNAQTTKTKADVGLKHGYSQAEADEEVLLSFWRYLGNRRAELRRPLTVGEGLDAESQYLLGYSTGVRAGLEMASDLVWSYLDYVRRGINNPDSIYALKRA
ncbi:MAG TPA: hypothetical protein VGB78_05385 [Thermoplasmata archaeon]